VAAFVALMLVGGRRVVPWLLLRVARTGSRELFTLSVLAIALGIAVGASALFGVSSALGAFFAGMVVNSSELSHEAATEALPLQDAFSVLFFVAVGMLFDPGILLERPLELLAVVLIVMVGKSIAAFAIVLMLGYPVTAALTISASLAQIGEFSFILAALALSLGLLPEQGQGLIVACALLTISLNPLVFGLMNRAGRWLGARPHLLKLIERAPGPIAQLPANVDEEALRDHVVIVGYGRVGSAIGETFTRQGIPHVVIEQNRERVEALHAQGLPILYGDAARPELLAAAHVATARLLVLALPDPYKARAIMERARALNPAIETAARSHSADERAYLGGHGVGLALVAEHELALGLAHHALLRMGCPEDEADATVDAVRRSSTVDAHARTPPAGDSRA
jgi:CPA2 family monovalent cation:H+ antiporter-2